MPEPLADSHEQEHTGDAFDWRDLLHVIVERRWIAVTVFVVVVTATALWTFRQTPQYRATAQIQVDMRAQNLLNIPDVLAMGEPGYMYNQYLNTMVKAIRSRTFAQRVAADLSASNDPAIRDLKRDTEALTRTIMGCMTVKQVPDSRLVAITVEHKDPALTALLANQVADSYIQQNLDRRMTTSTEAVSWLREQVDAQKERLLESETALRQYREQTRTVSLEQRQDIVVSKLKSVNESLTEAEVERIEAETRWRQVESLWQDGVAPENIPPIASDPLVMDMRRRLLEKRSDIAMLERRYKSEHPTLKRALAELTDLAAKYTEACGEARRNLETTFKLAAASEENLRRALREQEEQALALDRLVMTYDQLKRNADADRQLHDALLTRVKEASLTGKLETNNIRLIDRAFTPSTPFRPRPVSTLMRAAGAGLILGILMALGAHVVDDRIRRTRDFEAHFGLPLLGLIPEIDLPDVARRARAVSEDSSSGHAEAFRGVRASLALGASGNEARRIMITSAGAGEGKSLVASNLAIVLALNKEQTLLVDADFRRPGVHRAFGLEPAQVKPHPVIDGAPWTDAVTRTDVAGLDVLLVPRTPVNPAELIASPAMRDLLTKASANYDRVILDCPPLFGVSDPLVLLPDVDGVIVVARFNQTRRRGLEDAIQKLLEGKTPLLGAILNDVNPAHRGYTYYQYGYHYYHPNERPPSRSRDVIDKLQQWGGKSHKS